MLLGGTYNIPLDRKHRWLVNLTGTTAWVDYLKDFAQPRPWNSGVGGGLIYRSPSDSWQVALAYGFGFNALRGDDRGAQSVTILAQLDLDRKRRRLFDPAENVPRSGGLQQFFRSFFR